MNKKFLPFIVAAYLAVASFLAVHAAVIVDAIGDIDPGIATAGGTLDILSMAVTNTVTDLLMTLKVDGNVATTDWGQFMIGISTGTTATTNTGNGWARPIQANSPLGGMDYWMGSWVNAGGGSQLWKYDGASWTNTGALPGFTITPGSTSEITYTATLSSLGLLAGDTIWFDAYTSGGGGGDSAVDALSNPNVSITSWSQPYASSTTASGGPGLSEYKIAPIPEPVLLSLLGLAGAAFGIHRLRRRRNP